MTGLQILYKGDKVMEEKNFDRKKAIADMQNLKAKVISEIKADMLANGETEVDEEKLAEAVTIKYLGKIGLTNEQGELIEQDWYAAIENIGGQLQIVYYDENQNVLGRQFGMDSEIIPSEDVLIEKEKGFEKPKAMEELDEEGLAQAKTLEQLQEEQRKEEEEQAEGPQLTQEQVNRLSGPKIPLSQPVDKDIALKNKIGLHGDYIQFIDINEARKLIPDLNIAELGQRFLPIEILSRQ